MVKLKSNKSCHEQKIIMRYKSFCQYIQLEVFEFKLQNLIMAIL